jgi:soluble lytic murein transglycosylase
MKAGGLNLISAPLAAVVVLSFWMSACGSLPFGGPANEEAPPADSKDATIGASPEIPEALPAEALKTASSEEKLKIEEKLLAQELGFSPAELKTRAHALTRFLQEGLYPRAYCKAEKKDAKAEAAKKELLKSDETEAERVASISPSESFCELISDLEMPAGKASVRARQRRERRVPVRPHHFEEQQGMEVSRLLKSLSREPAERVLAWVPSMLKKQNCPRNLSAASALKLEGMLPDIVAKEAINKLYEHAAACLLPEDAGYERLHLRQSLLSYLWEDEDQALLAINRALLTREPKEMSRILFWAGFLQKKEILRKNYWDRLTEEYPMSYHALEVWRVRRVDPYKMLLSRPQIDFSRKVSESEKIVENPLRWLETLYHYGRITAAQKLALWITNEFRDELSLSTMLYISSIKSENNIPLNTIVFLNKEIGANPKLLNEQTLRMLFPKPYFEEFDRASPGLDTFLIMSVARQESGFNPKARSTANARGLLQLLPSTARILAGGRKRPNLYDAETNIALGVRYLDNLVEKLGSVELALAAYNAGPNRIPEWQVRYPTKNPILFMDLIPFQETRDYVALIVRNNYWYNRIYVNDIVVQKTAAGGEVLPRIQKKSSLVSDLIDSHSKSSN